MVIVNGELVPRGDIAGMQKRAVVAATRPEPETAPRVSREKENAAGSPLESRFAMLWSGLGGPPLEREVMLCNSGPKPRRWRVDFLERSSRSVFEIHGGIYSQGRHTRGDGFTEDCVKNNAHVLSGYRYFTLTAPMIRTEVLQELIEFTQRRSLPEKRVKRSLKPE